MDVEKSLVCKCFEAFVENGIQTSGIEYAITRGLSVKHFEDPFGEDGSVFKTMVQHVATYNSAPTREAILLQHPNYRFEVVQDSLDFVVDEFIRRVKRRETQKALIDMAERIDNREEQLDLELILFEAAEHVSQVVPSSRVSRVSDAPSRMELLRKRMEMGIIPGVQLGFPTLDNETLGIQPNELVVFAAYSNAGKALAVETPIKIPGGWTTMGDLKTGDEIFSPDGKTVRVEMAWPILLGNRCLEVEFTDGSTIVADENHLWEAYTPSGRKQESLVLAGEGFRDRPRHSMPRILTTNDLRPGYHSVTCAAPLDHPHQDLPLDPYLLGYWLGDGDSQNAVMTVAETDADHLVSQISEAGESWKILDYESLKGRNVKRIAFGRIHTCSRGHDPLDRMPSGWCRPCNALLSRSKTAGVSLAEYAPPTCFSFRERLNQEGLIGNKMIPDRYINASFDQRLALMQGIVDSDGHINKRGSTEIAVTNKKLSDGIFELALSLGLRATYDERDAKIEGRVVGRSYRVRFHSALPVARLPRKANRLPETCSTKTCHRMVSSVREVPSTPVRCITVDAEDGMFLAGRNLVPTHNSTYLQYSALAGYLVEQTAKTRLFISLEMDGNALLRKFDAMAAEIQLRAVKAMEMGRVNLSDDQMRSLDQWAERASKAPSDILIIDDIGSCTVERVLAETMRWKPVATYTDYLQYMDGPGDGSYSKVGAIAKGLKKVARMTGIPQITAAQTTRAGAKDGVKDDNIADSIEIYRSADWMFGIERDDDLDAERAARIKIVKARDGRKGLEFKVGMDFDEMDFAERGFRGRQSIGRTGAVLPPAEITELAIPSPAPPPNPALSANNPFAT